MCAYPVQSTECQPDRMTMMTAEDTTQVIQEEIGRRLGRFQDELAQVCKRLGRKPSGVKLVAVSKKQSAAAVEAAMAAGIGDFGENRVQEAESKVQSIASRPVWHMVGHLQTNKAARAAELFDWVQSVDSVRLAHSLGRGAERCGRKLNVLVQVNTTSEAQKSGCEPGDLAAVLEAVSAEQNLSLSGLMTIGPLSQTEAGTRKAFELAAKLRETWRGRLGDEAMAELIKAKMDQSDAEELTAIIKDEERCIRCGLCYSRCPVGAITMERFTFYEELVAV